MRDSILLAIIAVCLLIAFVLFLIEYLERRHERVLRLITYRPEMAAWRSLKKRGKRKKPALEI